MPTPDRAKIEAAIARLREGGPAAPDLADEVQALAGQSARTWKADPNTSFNADAGLLARVLEAHGKGSVPRLIEDGARRFLARELEPVRVGRGPAGSKEKVNFRIPAELRQQVKDACAERADEYGWPVKPVDVYTAALEDAVRGHRKKR